MIRRYRLYEAAEAARGAEVDWGALAADLGYADQAHLIRDFRAGFGMTPAAYGRPQPRRLTRRRHVRERLIEPVQHRA